MAKIKNSNVCMYMGADRDIIQWVARLSGLEAGRVSGGERWNPMTHARKDSRPYLYLYLYLHLYFLLPYVYLILTLDDYTFFFWKFLCRSS